MDTERSLSPVLIINNSHRKALSNRKRIKSKGKINLDNGFKEEFMEENNKKFVNKIQECLIELQECETNDFEGRLSKIINLENERKNVSNGLFNNGEENNTINKRKLVNNEEFTYKLPVLPEINPKKFKSNLCDNNLLITDNNNVNSDVSEIFNPKIFSSNFLSHKTNGFCTGAGKNIAVPEKHSGLFDDILDKNFYEPLSNKGEEILKGEANDVLLMQTSLSDTLMTFAADLAVVASRNGLNIADGIEENSASHQSLNCNNQIRNRDNDEGFRGFPIEELQESMNFNACVEEFIENTATTVSVGFTTTKHNNKIHLETLKETEKKFSDQNENFGFSTAGGKNIIISSKALKKAQEKFSKNDKDVEIKEEGKIVQSIQTSSSPTESKSFKISPEAEKVYSIEDKVSGIKEERKDLKNSVDQASSRFSITGGENIKISSTALNEDKKICCESDFDADTRGVETTTTVFSSGISPIEDENVKIHLDALLNEAKNMSSQDDFAINTGTKDIQKIAPASSFAGFSTAGGKNIKISLEALNQAKNKFSVEETVVHTKEETDGLQNTTTPSSFGSFSVGSKNIKLPQTAISKAKERFWKEQKVVDLKSAGETKNLDALLNEAKKMSSQDDFNVNTATASSSAGFSTAGGKNIKITLEALNQAKNKFSVEEIVVYIKKETESLQNTTTPSSSFHAVGSKNIKLSPTVLSEANKRSWKERKDVDLKSAGETKNLYNCPALPNTIPTTTNTRKQLKCKRRLGLSYGKQLPISNNKLQEAKSIFQECDIDKNLNKRREPQIYSSTPLKKLEKVPTSTPQVTKVTNLLTHIDITPIKPLPETETICFNHRDNLIVSEKYTESNIDECLVNLEKYYENLQRNIKVIVERQKALEIQKKTIQFADYEHRRRRPGILFNKKQTANKISIKKLLNSTRPGVNSEAFCHKIAQEIQDVTPKNAQNIHFNCVHNTNEFITTITTKDGAILIPNASDLVGLSEIKIGFEAMIGVDPNLLPKNWISNHFKWIVWKLAGLERNFPDTFADCLSVENIIQQLKYRYDREIDNAERSALRKILEKDDVPQKRMVLCVSDIIKVSEHTFELELTDGWYSIRTLIDEPLCLQVHKLKIVIGTKLITQCAEIVNCDGCHPLEVPENVKLKINYNSTRRAERYAKLGYQRTVQPFPIVLRSVHSDGGCIPCIKVHVVRVYPLKYMERQGRTVWRNVKAEEKRAQEWNNRRMKEMEVLEDKVRDEYEEEIRCNERRSVGKIDPNEIPNINSPKLLYELMTNANDPEGFMNLLSPQQITNSLEYKAHINSRHQQEMEERILVEMKKLEMSTRNVTSVLNLRIVDALEASSNSFSLTIWRPMEEHFQILKEGTTVTVFNVVPRHNGDLTTNSRTHFRLERNAINNNEETRRQVTPISMSAVYKPLFNEFDTVGTVVQVNVQEVWLTDLTASLLHIKIFESPETCCLLDNLQRGDNVAVINLMRRNNQSEKSYAQSFANQNTIITCYPQLKLLQTSLDTYTQMLPRDLPMLLNICDKKIHEINDLDTMKSRTLSFNGNNAFDNSLNDDFITTGETIMDVAMSLIDTDQYLKK